MRGPVDDTRFDYKLAVARWLAQTLVVAIILLRLLLAVLLFHRHHYRKQPLFRPYRDSVDFR